MKLLTLAATLLLSTACLTQSAFARSSGSSSGASAGSTDTNHAADGGSRNGDHGN